VSEFNRPIAKPAFLFTPAPGSEAEQLLRLGRSPWLPMVHLFWSIWVVLTPAFGDGDYGFTPRWFVLTAVSFPLFLWLYVRAIFAAPHPAYWSAAAMIALCLVLLPWYPSGLSYFVFGCVMLQPHGARNIWRYCASLAVLNALLVVYALSLGYPWQPLVWIPTITFIIGVVVFTENKGLESDVALKLSHEEVRRLAATAERERIGRDMHDLLGHTLSMVALKSDLAARLVTRDPMAASREINEVAHIARDALNQVRRAVSGIRAAGIAAELASAKLLLETEGVRFDYDFDPEFSNTKLSTQAQTALAMTVREAATNIQRHARAHSAQVSFATDNGHAILRVVDDGRGGKLVPGNGLNGMRERLEAVGGTLRFERMPSGGTQIEARVPLSGESEVSGLTSPPPHAASPVATLAQEHRS
jgi:two-component system sensor histidine kinase DesK